MPPQLATRQLGKDGPKVTAIGFGAMGLSAFYGKTASDEERLKVFDRAYELGQTFWDSADIYGDSEDLIGKWFKKTGKRDEIFLATKFANAVNPDGSRKIDSSPEYCKAAAEKSLKRLGIKTIDLYYCHRLDQKTPIEKTVQAMADLKKEGKIRYLGLSECSAESLRRAYAVHPIAAVQMEYSPFSLDIESPQTNLLKTCRELGVAVVAYSPLGRGFMTGQYKGPEDFDENDFRRVQPRFSKENFPKNLELVEKLKSIAEKKGCTAGQLTLAWLLAQGDDILPIPGTKKVKYVEENLGALNVTLTPEEEKSIRQSIESCEIHGSRYAQVAGLSLFADTPPLQ
ncbi:MAG: hypothetical protein M1819_005073 [Sarea resinae]|nr:MAG: hypothetical protein M1819_005073 [Sarea resinae]